MTELQEIYVGSRLRRVNVITASSVVSASHDKTCYFLIVGLDLDQVYKVVTPQRV